jgi:hypothetical protein
LYPRKEQGKMEIVRRTKDGLSVWRGKDVEGRNRYGATWDEDDGTAVEPWCLPWLNPNQAIHEARTIGDAS